MDPIYYIIGMVVYFIIRGLMRKVNPPEEEEEEGEEISEPEEEMYEFEKQYEGDEDEEGIISLDTLIRGTCEKNRFMDLVENFAIFMDVPGGLIKIVAKNHQYLGVNNVIRAVQRVRENEGRLGVFWHTQGSGKSASMMFFSQKVLRKTPGNWTFVIVTEDNAFGGSMSDNPQWVKDAILYEIYLRSFSNSGDFPGATAKLQEVKDLGATAIWLMPINEGPSDHGYAVDDYLAIEADYGTMDDFKDWTMEAGFARGMCAAECSWVLADNVPMNRVLEGYGADRYKTYRVYEMALD